MFWRQYYGVIESNLAVFDEFLEGGAAILWIKFGEDFIEARELV